MSTRGLRTITCTLAVLYSATLLAQPGSGTRWDVKMKMPGMDPEMQAQMEAMQKEMQGVQMPPGMQMPKMQGGYMSHEVCLAKDANEPPPANEGCTLVDQRSSGNHHFVKMQCPDGLVEVDQTRTANTMTANMKMTDRAGEVTEMQMEGKALGDCDYTAEVDAQRRQVAAIQKQAGDAQRRSEQQLAATCDEGLKNMQGMLFGKNGVCAARTAEYCARLQTVEGYGTFRAGIQRGMEQMPEYAPATQLKACGQTEQGLLAKLCPKAASAKDLRFVATNCPAERSRLCGEAVQREALWYVADHCPAERDQLVAQNCAGRKYSTQIAPAYRDFCTGALGADLGAGATGNGAVPAQPADPVQQGVKKGLDGLKKIFGN